MADKYEYYEGATNAASVTWGEGWHAETFTPQIAHKITSVKLLMFRVGSPETLTVSIRATSAGKPTGEDLCSGTMDGNTVTPVDSGEWYEITLGAGFNLEADTMYAIVLRSEGTDAGNCIRWRGVSANNYPRGTYVYSENYGVSWTALATWDLAFQDWGEAIAPPVVGRSHGYIIG